MSTKPKYQQAVLAASDQFLRYGFARTTMIGVARAAGMSRPTIYLLFPEGKMQLFDAALFHLAGNRISELKAVLTGIPDLADRLFKVCELWNIELFEMSKTVPDSIDMDNLAFPAVQKVYADICQIVAGLLHEVGVDEQSAADHATNLIFGVRGFPAIAKDDAHMRRMTRLQVDTLCKAIGSL